MRHRFRVRARAELAIALATDRSPGTQRPDCERFAAKALGGSLLTAATVSAFRFASAETTGGGLRQLPVGD